MSHLKYYQRLRHTTLKTHTFTIDEAKSCILIVCFISKLIMQK